MANLMRAPRNIPEKAIIDKVMHAVVQIVALRQGFMGQMAPAWTGSGTIVDPRGIILTNCHVANPRAMGMSAPPADVLAVAVTQRSDEPPALTYLAQIVAQSPELDLAVLRIVSGLDRKPVSNLNLPYVPVGDSDTLELGDTLSIFGYPGIGGETVTFTSGSVAGFTAQPNLRDRRAWIKTDATIAGGNSGGAAVDDEGELVGVPTQAAAGENIAPVDARPVVDTNRDGRIDERDTPMAIGGFINGLRPVNLAKSLLKQAGVDVAGDGSIATPMPSAPAPTRSPVFGSLVFSPQVTSDGRPINPSATLPNGINQIFVSFDYRGMQDGRPLGVVWAWNGQPVVNTQTAWEGGAEGRKTLVLSNEQGLPDGVYHLVLTVADQVISEGEVVVGRQESDTDLELSGQVVDAGTGQGIAGALVIALRPGVRVQDFIQQQNREMAFTSARTGSDGTFTFPQQLPKGQAYGLVVIARGYQDIAIDSALRINAEAPEKAQLSPIPLQRE
jgi:S1-C subfamily serine protease